LVVARARVDPHAEIVDRVANLDDRDQKTFASGEISLADIAVCNGASSSARRSQLSNTSV